MMPLAPAFLRLIILSHHPDLHRCPAPADLHPSLAAAADWRRLPQPFGARCWPFRRGPVCAQSESGGVSHAPARLSDSGAALGSDDRSMVASCVATYYSTRTYTKIIYSIIYSLFFPEGNVEDSTCGVHPLDYLPPNSVSPVCVTDSDLPGHPPARSPPARSSRSSPAATARTRPPTCFVRSASSRPSSSGARRRIASAPCPDCSTLFPSLPRSFFFFSVCLSLSLFFF